jgi:hypothetical protein
VGKASNTKATSSRRPSPIGSLRRTAFNRGVLGRQPGWAVLGALLWVARRMKAEREPKVVALEKLLPGQSMTLTTVRPPTRRERRVARK